MQSSDIKRIVQEGEEWEGHNFSSDVTGYVGSDDVSVDSTVAISGMLFTVIRIDEENGTLFVNYNGGTITSPLTDGDDTIVIVNPGDHA